MRTVYPPTSLEHPRLEPPPRAVGFRRRRGPARFQGLVVYSSVIAIAIGIVGLVGSTVPELSFLCYSPWHSVVFTPRAALTFFILGGALFLHVKSLLPSVAFEKHPRVDDGIGYTASFLLLGNAAILLSYFYGAPFLQTTLWTLPSLASTLASASLALGVIALRGPRQIPLRPLMGSSVQARLLRTFLPVTAAAVVIHSILLHTVFNGLNPVISMTLTAFLSMGIACLLVLRSSHMVSRQIERAVHESEERFGVLVESLEDYAIFMLDPEGHVASWNAGAERAIGYRAEDIIGDHVARFYGGDEAVDGRPLNKLKQAVAAGSYIEQTWQVRKDGTRFWADVTLTPLWDEAGHLRGYANVTRDITERKKAEEALRQKSAFMQILQVVSSAANEASTTEQAMKIGLEQIRRQMGWPIGHALIVSLTTGMLESLCWQTAPKPIFQQFLEEESHRRFAHGESLPGRVLASGSPVWVRDITQDMNSPHRRAAKQAGLRGGYAFPVKVGNEVVAVLEFFSGEEGQRNEALFDVMAPIGAQLGRVVERARGEAALRESEMRFRSVAQSANDAIVSCNAYGLIIAWNKGARTIFGYAEEEMLGTSISAIVPEALKILSPDNKELLLTGPTSVFGQTIESSGKHKTGEEFPIELSIADWKVGEDIFFTAIIRNILKRKEAEAHIDASLREKEVLLKEIHHRVKNNLQIISSLLRLQSQHVTDHHILDMFRESQNRVQSMALIHEYLYQSRDMARIHFSGYLQNLVSHLFRSYGATPETVALDLRVDESPLDLDAAIPCGLIITELVSNALKHAFGGSRKGNLVVDFRAMPGNRFELMVKDDGIGMRIPGETEPTTSLGLRLVKTLVKQLSGEIHVDGTRGTTFKISFMNAHKLEGG